MDGEQVEVKVLEVSKTEIKYKLTGNMDGPIYVLSKSELYMVEYANGSKEVYANKSRDSNALEKNKSDTS
ncbi:MAG: hypothetical protein QF371_00090, partial [Flavobacteriales bacterium]|nr:hypothetical protein [Flavobacteriales bacterium]